MITESKIILIFILLDKPNILRFANTSDVEQTSNDSISDHQSQSSSFYLQGSNSKSSNLGKNKKSRKSPGPEQDTEMSTINKSEGVRSPAYSDISDDSNTPTENNLNGELKEEISKKSSLTLFFESIDKLKVSSDIKKSQEPGIANPLSIGGYNNMYGQFYQPSPFFQPPDNQSTKALTQPPSSTGSLDYNKSKEHSPLDLINKLQPSKNPPNETTSSSSNPVNPNNVGKMMQHYQHYPYKYDYKSFKDTFNLLT